MALFVAGTGDVDRRHDLVRGEGDLAFAAVFGVRVEILRRDRPLPFGPTTSTVAPQAISAGARLLALTNFAGPALPKTAW